MNIDQDTPLHLLRAHLLLIPEDTSEQSSIVIMEAADRLDLLGAEVEDLRNLNRNNCAAEEALLDRIKQLEDRIDLLEACNADVARIAKERNEALDRIKRLEEAGDRVIYWVDASNARLEYFDALNNWKQAKEDKP